MFVDTFLDKTITTNLREAEIAESAKHSPSGKLSASGLSSPVQWQVLKTLGVGVRHYDDYTLRKFKRGRDIEDWLMTHIPGIVETQKPVSYRNVVGLVDAVVDTADYDHKLGVIPHEVKSVTNAKYKRIEKEGRADEGHMFQGGLYALALGSPYYAIDYVASDDLRVLSYVYPTKDIKPAIEAIIDRYDDCIKRQVIPVFEARYKWQADKKYTQYEEWQGLTEEECAMALNYYYPGAWEKVTIK